MLSASNTTSTPTLCRDCLWHEVVPQPRRCPRCSSPRLLSHGELFTLSVAHMDCDAFFASVEKRDNPDLADLPVIVGGGTRGVVSTCCYLARLRGVRSAMPMFQARKLCPDAVVIRPRMEAYRTASKAIRAMMDRLTPLVEPLSLDEAFMDLTGTARLHGAPPAVMLAGLVRRMQGELGLGGSIGLSHNKFLAKLASDLDKPRGFAVIGEAETAERLAMMPVSRIWGAGPVMVARLHGAGLMTFADLQRADPAWLAERFGSFGLRLAELAFGQDRRPIGATNALKSISNETTFATDIGALSPLETHLWQLAEQVSARAKAAGLAGRVLTLKLKTSEHRSLTRRVSLDAPTELADVIFRSLTPRLRSALAEGPFRLIGAGLSELVALDHASGGGDLFDTQALERARAERATDALRARFGPDIIRTGRGL